MKKLPARKASPCSHSPRETDLCFGYPAIVAAGRFSRMYRSSSSAWTSGVAILHGAGLAGASSPLPPKFRRAAVVLSTPIGHRWQRCAARKGKGFRESESGDSLSVASPEFDAPCRMVWTGGMPIGLFRGPRFYELAMQSPAETAFPMREGYTGPLVGMIGRSIPDVHPAFVQFARCLEARGRAVVRLGSEKPLTFLRHRFIRIETYLDT